MNVVSSNVSRIALNRQAAATSLGMSIDSFEPHVRLEQRLTANEAPAALADEIRDPVAGGLIRSSSAIPVSVSHGSSGVSAAPSSYEPLIAVAQFAQLRDDVCTP